ncbi:Dihydrolipoyllysine-residue succinyltransferase component of 2-oxoglutarate dehydrogenase complex, mitochondrial [Liparis tanakae]|uniref:Dihydrolipoyllysine-residue succinyltransferase component of 2-oxoglutarate dehydrogenase complex, mitochondrial n=1 Tax=Liparis tanakae TaxID=230148 RepID=A0A4Z2IEX4_9TELE|nr:Dihydrolipoyllysine-residue succinyltransferase component of 2-oxoglutarate dehydrogenase complex, mitochondrial [Liparis tanakae]
MTSSFPGSPLRPEIPSADRLLSLGHHVIPFPVSHPELWPFPLRYPPALSASHALTLNNNNVKSDPRSSVFQIQYFRTSAPYRDEVITVKTPAFAESVTEGDVRWEKAVGDTVSEDEVVCEIETDKVPAPASGVIEELLIPDGGKVEAGTALFKLRKGAAPPKAEAPAAAAAAAPPPPPSAPPPPPPSAAGPIPTAMPPVPPVPAHAMNAKPVSAIKPTAAGGGAKAEGGAQGARTESRVKMNRMRLRIAQRLKEAQNTCAMLTTFNEVDMR